MELQQAFDAGFDAVKAYLDQELGLMDKKIITLARSVETLALQRDGTLPSPDRLDSAKKGNENVDI